MRLISCGERVFLVFFGFFICLCKHQTETTALWLHNSLFPYTEAATHDNRSIPLSLSVYCHQKQQGYLNVYLLGAQSEPVLLSILSEANTIKDQEAGHVGLFGAWGQRVSALVWDNAQAPTHCVVAHFHQLV